MLKVIKTIVALVLVSVIFAWVFYYYQITAPVSSGDSTVEFEIKNGWGVHQISQALNDRRLIRNQFFFETHIWLRNLQRNFKAGVHQLSPTMNIKEIVALLTESGGTEQVITIIEGWNKKEITQYLVKQGLINQTDFLSLLDQNSPMASQYSFLSDKPKDHDLEGYLFPDTYRVFKYSTPEEIIKKMLNNFDQKLSEDLRVKIKDQNKSIFEIITLASIIEKEVMNYEDMKMVADIFYKRLKEGIALQSDATINFITGKGIVQPTIDDTKIDHPYNTYQFRDLPPGPISNPGLNAIIAAIEPTPNQYFYFLTTKEGEVIYSTTYQEHLIKKAKYLD